jgi:ABC-2 type transport system permease protein
MDNYLNFVVPSGLDLTMLLVDLVNRARLTFDKILEYLNKFLVMLAFSATNTPCLENHDSYVAIQKFTLTLLFFASNVLMPHSMLQEWFVFCTHANPMSWAVNAVHEEGADVLLIVPSIALMTGAWVILWICTMISRKVTVR